MNWKFTRPNFRVRFEKNEAFCFIFPVQRGVLEHFSPEIIDIDKDPQLERQHLAAKMKRNTFYVAKQLKERFNNLLTFQGWYMSGKLPDDSGSFANHQKSLVLKPFVRIK